MFFSSDICAVEGRIPFTVSNSDLNVVTAASSDVQTSVKAVSLDGTDTQFFFVMASN